MLYDYEIAILGGGTWATAKTAREAHRERRRASDRVKGHVTLFRRPRNVGKPDAREERWMPDEAAPKAGCWVRA